MKKLNLPKTLENFKVNSIEIIGCYDKVSTKNKPLKDENNKKLFKVFKVNLHLAPKNQVIKRINKQFNNNNEITYDNIDKYLVYETTENKTTIDLFDDPLLTENDKLFFSDKHEYIYFIDKSNTKHYNGDFIQKIEDGNIVYYYRDTETRIEFQTTYEMNDYYTWKDASKIIKDDIENKQYDNIKINIQDIENVFMGRSRSFRTGEEIIFDYNKDLVYEVQP